MNIDAAAVHLREFLAGTPSSDFNLQVRFLADKGYSKIECIGALNRVNDMAPNEAKTVVHHSPAFEYRRESDDEFHNSLISLIEQDQS